MLLEQVEAGKKDLDKNGQMPKDDNNFKPTENSFMPKKEKRRRGRPEKEENDGKMEKGKYNALNEVDMQRFYI